MANKNILHKVFSFPVLINIFFIISFLISYPETLIATAKEDPCIECHRKYTPRLVEIWLTSEMSKQTQKEITCSTCHGVDHQTEADYDKASSPTAATCEECHEERVKQFKAGKHSNAWKAISTMPMLADQPQMPA